MVHLSQEESYDLIFRPWFNKINKSVGILFLKIFITNFLLNCFFCIYVFILPDIRYVKGVLTSLTEVMDTFCFIYLFFITLHILYI